MNDPLLRTLAPVAAPATLLRSVLRALGLVADRYVVRPSPVGEVLITHNDRGISACIPIAGRALGDVASEFRSRFGRSCEADPSPPAGLVDAIDGALAGGSPASLAFDVGALRPFQRAVLDKTSEIPAGQVRSYGWVAAAIGRPAAVRAVGTALGRNPIPLLIPCHRVVRSDGRIGDYGLGPPAKLAVLAAEGVDVDAERSRLR